MPKKDILVLVEVCNGRWHARTDGHYFVSESTDRRDAIRGLQDAIIQRLSSLQAVEDVGDDVDFLMEHYDGC